MGNPSWGAGYHAGYGDGAKEVGTIVGVAFLAGTGLIAAGRWRYGKYKDRQLAKADLIAADMDDPELEPDADPQSTD